MLLGIIADSHGQAQTTRAAVTLLKQRGAEKLIHLGDIGTKAVLDELIGHEAHIVLGNCDWDAAALRRYAQQIGITVDHPMGTLVIGDSRVAYTHGHVTRLMDEALGDGVDYLLHGHSHQVRDERIGSTRVINPGALFRASRYTGALLDPGRDALEVLEIPNPR
jgi:hypothetical protein